MGGVSAEKQYLEWRGWNKLTEVNSYRHLLAVIIDDGAGDEFSNSGVREVFVRGGDRRDDRFVSGSAVVGGETRQRQGLCKQSRETWYYSFL